MSIRWTRIHAELGLAPGPLTFEMVEQAVAAGMAEAEDLDWKQAFPHLTWRESGGTRPRTWPRWPTPVAG